MRYACTRSSKDLNYSFLSSLLLDKILTKTKILTDKSIPMYKEFLPKKSFKKNPPKKFLQKNFSKKFPKNLKRKIPKNSRKFPKKIRKISKLSLKRFLGFWKYPIPYIALRGRKPLRACLFWHSKQCLYKTCSEFVFSQYRTRKSMKYLPWYCGITDSRMSVSDTDLPVLKASLCLPVYKS